MTSINGQSPVMIVAVNEAGEFGLHVDPTHLGTAEEAGEKIAEWLATVAEHLRRNGAPGSTREIYDRLVDSLADTARNAEFHVTNLN